MLRAWKRQKESWDLYRHNTVWFIYTLLATKRKKIYDPPKILPQPLSPFGKVVWLVPMASKEKKT